MFATIPLSIAGNSSGSFAEQERKRAWERASQPRPPLRLPSHDRPERRGPERGGPERDSGASRARGDPGGVALMIDSDRQEAKGGEDRDDACALNPQCATKLGCRQVSHRLHAAASGIPRLKSTSRLSGPA